MRACTKLAFFSWMHGRTSTESENNKKQWVSYTQTHQHPEIVQSLNMLWQRKKGKENVKMWCIWWFRFDFLFYLGWFLLHWLAKIVPGNVYVNSFPGQAHTPHITWIKGRTAVLQSIKPSFGLAWHSTFSINISAAQCNNNDFTCLHANKFDYPISAVLSRKWSISDFSCRNCSGNFNFIVNSYNWYGANHCHEYEYIFISIFNNKQTTKPF